MGLIIMIVKKRIVIFLICVLFLICGCQKSENPSIVEEELSYVDKKVSYLGPEGTYTQEACNKYFNNEGEYIPYPSVDEAVEALISKKSDYALIPQENTIGGPVIDYVDILLNHDELYVVGEVELPISQNLLSKKDAELSDIKVVYSHPQGLIQGSKWLKENLKDAELIEVSSTAEGAKKVSEAEDKNCAAIASKGAADIYGLKVLAENIQENDSNKTRFYVLSLDEPDHTKKERIAFVANGEAKDLPVLMKEVERNGFVLVTIHDRPLRSELGEYQYLIECENGDYAKYQKLLKTDSFVFRYLGSFNVKR